MESGLKTIKRVQLMYLLVCQWLPYDSSSQMYHDPSRKLYFALADTKLVTSRDVKAWKKLGETVPPIKVLLFFSNGKLGYLEGSTRK